MGVLSPEGVPGAVVGVLGAVLLASMLMLLCRTMRDLAMVVSREEEAELGIMDPDFRAVFAGVEGADVTTGTSGFVGSSLVNVPWRMRRGGDGEGGAAADETLALEPPIAPKDGCLPFSLGTSELLLLQLLRTDPFPFISSEFRFIPMLDRALRGCGRVFEVSTRELWVRSFGTVG